MLYRGSSFSWFNLRLFSRRSWKSPKGHSPRLSGLEDICVEPKKKSNEPLKRLTSLTNNPGNTCYLCTVTSTPPLLTVTSSSRGLVFSCVCERRLGLEGFTLAWRIFPTRIISLFSNRNTLVTSPSCDQRSPAAFWFRPELAFCTFGCLFFFHHYWCKCLFTTSTHNFFSYFFSSYWCNRRRLFALFEVTLPTGPNISYFSQCCF